MRGDIKHPMIRVQKDDLRLKRLQVAILQEIEGVGFSAAENITMTEIEDCQTTPVCMTLDATASQRLMDDLWQCGVRPTESECQSHNIKALKYHLEDMRRLVFKKDYVNEK